MIQNCWHRLVKEGLDGLFNRCTGCCTDGLNKGSGKSLWSNDERYNKSKRECRSRGTKSEGLDMKNGRRG